MKTIKVVLSCQSCMNQIQDSQTIFGAICNIIKHTQGESQLFDYLNSFKDKTPYFVHSSMFVNDLFPMIKKNLFSLDLVRDSIAKSDNEKIELFEEFKKYKKINQVSEDIYLKYFLNNRYDDLAQDIMANKDQYYIENDVLSFANKKNHLCSKTIMLTKNGTNDKSLYYSNHIYYPIGTEFCIYIKTNKELSYIEEIFKYFEYFGIGSRRSVGLNVFRFERIESVSYKSNNTMKIILSKYIPKETIVFEKSYYQVETQVYRTSKDYASNTLLGKFTHFKEGSCLMMKDDKEFYGELIEVTVNNHTVYHYGLGFVF